MPTASPGSQPFANNLMLCYKFDEVSGTTFYDSVASNNGTISGTNIALDAVGIINQALDSTGQTGYGSVPNNSSWANLGGNAFSISCWVYLHSLATTLGYPSWIVDASNSASPYWAYGLLFGDDVNYLAFYIGNTDGSTFDCETTTGQITFAINTWYHIVAVNTGSGTAPAIYVNGTNCTGYNSPSVYSGTVLTADSAFYVANDENFDRGLDGRVDELCLWNRGLSAVEITYLYNGGSGRQCAWQFLHQQRHH